MDARSDVRDEDGDRNPAEGRSQKREYKKLYRKSIPEVLISKKPLTTCLPPNGSTLAAFSSSFVKVSKQPS
jgi:hypothetical protein